MKKTKEKEFNKLRTDFLPEALEIVERPAAPLGNVIIWLVFALILAFVLWACIGRMDEVATARGQIVADEGIQEVQAAGAGIVTEIRVKEGDKICRGDVLFCMKKDMEQKGIEYSEGEMGLLELRIELLGKLLEGESIKQYRQGSYDAEQMEVIEAMIAMDEADRISLEEYGMAVQLAESRRKLAETNLGGNQDKKEYLEKQKQLQEKQSDELENVSNIELKMLEDDYEYASEEVKKYKKLYDVGAVAKAELEKKETEAKKLKMQIDMKKTAIQNEALESEGGSESIAYQMKENGSDLQIQIGAAEEAQQNYETAQKDLEAAMKQRSEKLYEMKKQYVDELKQYDVQIAQQYEQYESKNIVALYDGIVKSLEVDKEGAVVTASQVVAKIIPDSGEMIVKAEVPNSDIGYVKLGQNADVKVDTYDYQKYGKLSATVVYISPDAFENEQMQKIYEVELLLKQTENMPDISQGMECTVEIKTDNRRIIEFFLEPLTDALDRGLKER